MGTLGENLRQPAYGDPVRDERWFRYSVKCDRAFAARLDEAARKAGVSVTTLVQQHFDAILEPRQAVPEGRAFNASAFNAPAFARRNTVSIAAAQIWGEMRRRADGHGEVRLSYTDLMTATGVPYGSIARAILQLKEADLVEQLSGAGGSNGAKYRVMGE